MRGRITAAAAVAAIALAGCSGGITSSASPGKKPDPAADVQGSAQKVQELTSYKADVVIDVTGGKQGAVSSKGVVRYQRTPTQAFDMKLNEVTVGGQQFPGGVELRLFDDTVYAKVALLTALFPQSVKPWIKANVDELGQRAGVNFREILNQIRQVDLVALTTLLTAGQEVKLLGKETVGGGQTTHYAGTVPVEAALALLDPKVRESVRPRLEDVKEIKYDLWMDDQGMPRKIIIGGESPTGKLTITALVSDFNVPVDITPPPADQVTDLKQLIGPN